MPIASVLPRESILN